MTSGREDASGSGSGSGSGAGVGGGGFHRVQAERDLESNWEVDLAHELEDYLLKICSGEIPASDDAPIPVNFAEAALLLQGSVQVYSRKVEYLYSLVLRALEFLSHKRQEEQLVGNSDQRQERAAGSKEVADEENDLFWGLDDIPVEAKNCLDTPSDIDPSLNYFVKPPANLVVLEGDCLDTGGDAGELESYLLATSDLYRGFILLDPCDAIAVHDYLDGDKDGRRLNSAYKGSTGCRTFRSPTRRSGGASHKSSVRKNQDVNVNLSPLVGCSFDVNNNDVGPDPPAPDTFNYSSGGFDMDDRHSEPGDFDDSDDEDDPWKPLNPHEPGNLKVKPFRKVKGLKRNGATTKHISISTLFPPARLHGTICPDLRRMWEMRNHAHERRKRRKESQSPLLYEKLRQQLIDDGNQTFDAFVNPDEGNEENDNDNDNGIPDFGLPDDNMPGYMDEDVHFHNEQQDGDGPNFGVDDAFGHEDINVHTNLEDLCRSHLDALLASIAETEKQSELAARVTTWKKKIEHNLEEQDSHPEFDIHNYGERILNKLSLEAEDTNILSFADVVKGQEKYDVARSFSALLQLVNNGDVELERSGIDGQSVCYTATNPFQVRLLAHDNGKKEADFCFSRKRVKSPTRKSSRKGDKENFGIEKSKSPSVDTSKLHESTEIPSQPNGKFSVKVRKIGTLRCTPEGKKRRRSRLVEPVDLHSAG